MNGAREQTAAQIAQVFRDIRERKPLVHMLPNTVSAALCADGLSALGARPLMAVDVRELREITEQSDASVVNLGQLNQEKTEAAGQLLRCAAEFGKPLVLDPVGCGASGFRLQEVQKLLALPWNGIVKGNRSELYSIQRNQCTREGVDAIEMRELSLQIPEGRVYFVTGKADCILWDDKQRELLKPCIVQERTRYNIAGSGCLVGAVTGACSSVAAGQNQQQTYILAASAASLGMAFALEQAGTAGGYGSAKTALLDGLSRLSEPDFERWLLQ